MFGVVAESEKLTALTIPGVERIFKTAVKGNRARRQEARVDE
jgi:hypothetical protein